MAEDNLEVEGFLDNAALTADDLRNGLYDYADIEIFTANWADRTVSMGKIILRTGRFGQVTLKPSGEFRVELRGLIGLLQQKIGKIYQPECNLDLGDSVCKVKVQPDHRSSQTAYALGDRVIVPTLDTTREAVELAITNHDFETGDLTGWTGVGYSAFGSNFSISAYEGSYYARHESGSSELNQTISLEPGAPITTTKIDNGDYTVQLRVWRSAEEWGIQSRVQVQFLDGAMASVNAGADDFDSGWENIRPEREWTEYVIDVPVPATARHASIRFSSREDSDIATWSTQFGVWDDVRLIMFDNEYETNGDYSRYENREYECTVAGTTALARPTFDTTVGNTTVDGTATWTARLPRWKWYDTVSAVTDRRVFDVTNANLADDVFNWGVVEWLTGDNAGRRIEIKDWDQSSQEVTTALSSFYDIQVGDTLTMTVGCDKSRSPTTGCKAFDNVINFGGYPEIPGTDEYFRVGGTGRKK